MPALIEFLCPFCKRHCRVDRSLDEYKMPVVEVQHSHPHCQKFILTDDHEEFLQIVKRVFK